MSDKLHVRRGELRLARDSAEPLRVLPLDPDPLSVFAGVFAMLRSEQEDDVSVVIDLLPASAARRRRLRKRLAKSAGGGRGFAGRPPKGGALPATGGFFQEMGNELTGGKGAARVSRPSTRMTPVQVVGQRNELRGLSSKLLDPDAMFELQILVRTRSRSASNAEALFSATLSAFEIFSAENEFRVCGLRVFGATFLGADMPWRRRWFDYRLRTGYFRPTSRGGNIVNAREIAGLLKPPTIRCPDKNVLRAGPYLSPAPRDLPRYNGQPGVLPLGRVMRDEEPVMVGMDMSEFFFGGIFGRSRFGKTELALVQLAHVAIVERTGGFLFDPHVDAIERLRPYLTEDGVRERVVELNLAKRSLDARHVSWNPLSMSGYGQDRIADRTNALVDSFAVAAGWSSRGAPRTMAILTNVVTSLLHLGLQLPAELQPTVFTIPRMLLDKDWRMTAVARLPEHLARFWITTYENYGPDASGPICQLVSRLQANPTVRATFGAGASTYDPRRAMDAGAIVLAAPSAVTDQLVSSIIMQGHIDAARSRADMPPADRRLFYAFFDETQIYDQAASSRGSAIAEILEQTAKYGWRAVPMAQSPHRLSDATIEALTTNASFLLTTATNAKGARFFGEQWSDVDARRAVMGLERFHYIAQPTHRGRRAEPFRLDGVPLEDLWADHKHEDRLGDLDAAIDARWRPRTVRQTLELIDGHDDRVLHALQNAGPPIPAPVLPGAREDAELDDLAGPGGFSVRPIRPPARPGS